MRLKALLLALAVAGAGSSFALADNGGGGGGHNGDHHRSASTTTNTTGTTTTAMTTTTTPSNCQRVELRGTLASVSASSFTLTVQRAGDENQAQSLVGQTVTIAVDANTRVSWSGQGTLIGPNVGDQAKVKASSCPGTTAGTTTLTATSVRANAATSGGHDGHDALKTHQ